MTPKQAAEQIVPKIVSRENRHDEFNVSTVHYVGATPYATFDMAYEAYTGELTRVTEIVREVVEGARRSSEAQTRALRDLLNEEKLEHSLVRPRMKLLTEQNEDVCAKLATLRQQLADLTRRHEEVYEVLKLAALLGVPVGEAYGTTMEHSEIFERIRAALAQPAEAKASFPNIPQATLDKAAETARRIHREVKEEIHGPPDPIIVGMRNAFESLMKPAEAKDARPPMPTHPSGKTPIWKVPKFDDLMHIACEEDGDADETVGEWRTMTMDWEEIDEADYAGLNWHRWCIPADDSRYDEDGEEYFPQPAPAAKPVEEWAKRLAASGVVGQSIEDAARFLAAHAPDMADLKEWLKDQAETCEAIARETRNPTSSSGNRHYAKAYRLVLAHLGGAS